MSICNERRVHAQYFFQFQVFKTNIFIDFFEPNVQGENIVVIQCFEQDSIIRIKEGIVQFHSDIEKYQEVTKIMRNFDRWM